MKALRFEQSLVRQVLELAFFEEVKGDKKMTFKKILTWALGIAIGVLALVVVILGAIQLITHSRETAKLLLRISGSLIFIGLVFWILHITGWVRRFHISNPTSIPASTVATALGAIGVAGTVFTAFRGYGGRVELYSVVGAAFGWLQLWIIYLTQRIDQVNGRIDQILILLQQSPRSQSSREKNNEV